jgi:hypothetical protein
VSDYKHNNVVRASQIINNAYGEKFSTATTFTADQTFNYNCKIVLNPKWNYNNIYVSAVIWKKNPDVMAICKYLFVNIFIFFVVFWLAYFFIVFQKFISCSCDVYINIFHDSFTI